MATGQLAGPIVEPTVLFAELERTIVARAGLVTDEIPGPARDVDEPQLGPQAGGNLGTHAQDCRRGR